jgi:hypothetical protein
MRAPQGRDRRNETLTWIPDQRHRHVVSPRDKRKLELQRATALYIVAVVFWGIPRTTVWLSRSLPDTSSELMIDFVRISDQIKPAGNRLTPISDDEVVMAQAGIF